ncbi:MAG TPA: LysE family transporter [Clostridia bacterium]|nr:LysE family transporter [Clostridia bacterium]
MIGIFFKSLLIGYSGAIMPGSMLTYTIDKSFHHGAKSGVLVALGHSLVDMFLVILLFAGTGRFLTGDLTKSIIGLVGGIVLFYLGIKMAADAFLNKISLENQDSKSSGQRNMFFAGFILSITNPLVIVWWSVIGLALIMSSYSAFGIAGVAVFYFGHILADVSWLTFISALVGKTSRLLTPKVYKMIILLLAVCLIGFGINFLIGSIRVLF